VGKDSGPRKSADSDDADRRTWNARAEADAEILSVLTNRPYEQVARPLQFDVPPVWSAGSYRGVTSKTGLLFGISKSVAEKDLNEFFTLAEYVL